MKIPYCGAATDRWIKAGVPFIWKPFVVFDGAFIVLFIWAGTVLSAAPETRQQRPAA